jgi:hypothetical protein
MPRWLISCRDYAELVSNGMDQPLDVWERLALRLHGWICPPCARVKAQLEALRAACRWKPLEPVLEGDCRLPDESRQRILAALAEIVKTNPPRQP